MPKSAPQKNLKAAIGKERDIDNELDSLPCQHHPHRLLCAVAVLDLQLAAWWHGCADFGAAYGVWMLSAARRECMHALGPWGKRRAAEWCGDAVLSAFAKNAGAFARWREKRCFHGRYHATISNSVDTQAPKLTESLRHAAGVPLMLPAVLGCRLQDEDSNKWMLARDFCRTRCERALYHVCPS